MRIAALVPALLLAATTQAAADWRRAGESANATFYLNEDTIRRDGAMTWMWNITDYREQQTWEGYTFLSSKSQSEYDCERRRVRIILEQGFTGHMAQGKTTYSIDKEGGIVMRPAPKMTDQKCEKCQKPMLLRIGKRGPFLTCSGFPRCRNLKKAV